MKTASEVRLARTLLATFDNAREFAETFEDAKYENFPIVEIREIGVTEEPNESRSSQGLQGSIEIPKALAAEWMRWLETRAQEELAKIGVKV